MPTAVARPWNEALDDALRGIAGGLVFGVPLLYTMEVWWLGQTVSPSKALIALALTFAPVALLMTAIGFRRRPDVNVTEVVLDVVTAVGLGLVAVAFVLVILQRITLRTPLPIATQMIVYEAAPFALGAAVAGEVFGRAANRGRLQRDDDEEEDTAKNATLADLAATAMGAAFIALSIAPTEEVPMLVTGIEQPWLLVLIAASILVTYLIVFSAGFTNEEARLQHEGLIQRPVPETLVAYLVSLVTSGALLWFFENLDTAAPTNALAQAVVLSFPASVGGAAGRLVV
ncbi:MAG TPA: TIGR02587 family membrane protein [Acidimicrobiales bacterium]|nr:TIGR02587 family membrane protein [Acidimicrobiales bacterium]